MYARYEGIREELKTTAAHTWTVTIEWLLLTNMEIKTANIFDDILKAKPSNESSEHTMTVDSVMAEWDGHKPEDITRLYSLLK